MDIAVLTSLYPSAVRPHEGVFAERRWTLMRERGHAVRIVQPLPLAPPAFLPRLPTAWREVAHMARRELRGGLEIARPRYLHLPGRDVANARAFAACGIAALLARGVPEVVVADYAWPAAMAAEGLAERGVPCVVSGRGSDVLQVAAEPGLAPLLAGALRAAGHWCAVSRDLVRAMNELAGGPPHGVLVQNGVDLDLFAPRERAKARAHLGLQERGQLVLVVGHLIPRKDPLLALEAFARWRAASGGAGRLAFVGRGPLRAELEAAAARLCPEAVELVGEVDPPTLARWYAACDVLLLTSTREGRPNVVLEALACGRPVLATAAGGTSELLEGLDGMLAAERDPAALARGLERLLAHPPRPELLRARVAGLTWSASAEALERCLMASIRDAR